MHIPMQAPQRTFLPAVPRIIAIGDLHGDLDKARRAFRLGGLIDENDRWIGGTTTAVQARGLRAQRERLVVCRCRAESSCQMPECGALTGWRAFAPTASWGLGCRDGYMLRHLICPGIQLKS